MHIVAVLHGGPTPERRIEIDTAHGRRPPRSVTVTAGGFIHSYELVGSTTAARGWVYRFVDTHAAPAWTVERRVS